MTGCRRTQDNCHRGSESGPEIVVIDYGLGNLRSVTKALQAAGARIQLTSEPEKIVSARGAVLPGVGAFSAGMQNLQSLHLLPAILERMAEGKPLLGICLGLQLLFTVSEEHGLHKGLDAVAGRVVKFGGGLKIPHMGWNTVKPVRQSPAGILFEGIPDDSFFYFVHSYYVVPEDESVVSATTEYGVEFASAIARRNLFAVQFHPEKSGDLGLRILENFVNYVG
ncbi:imidazole glycerol phosphate synthase subunit HisH [bacterium]|nr:imidazole glycerol phosphate synthase subunit HisH [bacterium]